MKHGKHILLGLLGLGLVAGALCLWLQPGASVPDSSGEIAAPLPMEKAAEGEPPAVSTPEPGPAISSIENKALSGAVPSSQDSGAAAPQYSGTVIDAEPSKDAFAGEGNADYADGIAAMVAAIQAGRTLDPEAIAMLLKSPDPKDQVSGLALMAGLGSLDGQYDCTRHPVEVVLAAVDLCGSLFGDAAAQTLLGAWTERMGGAQSAGEAAHTQLLEVWLPYGGGSTALDLMMSVNDAPSILAGLCDFALNVELPPSIRADAFIRLRDQMDLEAYRQYIQQWVGQAEEDGGPWASRAERLAELVESSSAALSGPDGTGLRWFEESLARPYPGMVEDFELYLRHETRAGRLVLDAETAAALQESVEDLDKTSLAGPDVAAWHRLQRELGVWAQAGR